MNRAEALTRARKLFGKWVHLSENNRALTQAQKEPLLAELKDLREQRAQLNKRITELEGATRGYRRTIGRIQGAAGIRFNVVIIQGDTWADCFARFDEKKRKEEPCKQS